MEPKIKISKEGRNKIAGLLNVLLADEAILQMKTKKAHWNVEGPHFMELHNFFGKQYEDLDNCIDEVAERIRMLGHFAVGSFKDYLKITHLLENDEEFTKPSQTIETLLSDHETIIGTIKNDIIPVSDKNGDIGTTDFVTGLLQMHEKMAWMLRAHIS